jgi:hypothetical protein
MINQYLIFQKNMRAAHYCSNVATISFAVEVDGKFEPKVVNSFCKLLLRYLPELKANYLLNQILPLTISDEEFLQNKISQVSNQDDTFLLLKSHNTRLDIEHGETFRIIINSKENKSSFILNISYVVVDGISTFILSVLLNFIFHKRYIKLFMFKLLLNKANKNKAKFLNLSKYQFSGFNSFDNQQYQQKFPVSQHKAMTIFFEFPKPSDAHIYSGKNVTIMALQGLKQICLEEKVVLVRRLISLREKLPFMDKLALGNFYIPQKIEYNLSDFSSIDTAKKVVDATFNLDNMDAIIEELPKSENNLDKYCFDTFLNKNISLTISALKFDVPDAINGFDLIGGATIVGVNPYNHWLMLQIVPINHTLKIIYLCNPNVSNSAFSINFLTGLFDALGLDYQPSVIKNKILDNYKLIEQI